MDNSKKYLEKNNTNQYISFKDGEAHTVKLMDDKEDTMPDRFGKEGGTINGMKYLVEENGIKKTFFTSSIGLISKLSEFEKGSTITIQMKSVKINDEFRSEFVVLKGSKIKSTEEDTDTVPTSPEW